MRNLGRYTLVGAALLLASGCFYTEEINERPTPGIRVFDVGPYFVGDVVKFDATKSIDNRPGGLRAQWQAFSCVDGQVPRCQPLGSQVFGTLDTEFSVTLSSHESVEVQLRVTDAHGSTRLQPDRYSIVVGNREPNVLLQSSGYQEGGSDGPFVLYRNINISATDALGGTSSFDPDGDAVALEWQLFPPAGSQSSARSFEANGSYAYRLVPDVEGQWDVVVSVDDGHGGTSETTKTIVVGPDSPPCLQGLDPLAVDDAYYLVDSFDGPRRFSVLSASDALDPFPAALDSDPALGEASFRWFLKSPGATDFVELEGFTASDYVVDPNAYNPGETLQVRVEVGDRVEGAERELPCASDVWTCALETGTGCEQRRTWGVDIQ